MIGDLMETTDVAARLGVAAKTVRQYKSRGDMPPPDTTVGRSPLWRTATIEAWIAGRRGQGWRKGQQQKTT